MIIFSPWAWTIAFFSPRVEALLEKLKDAGPMRKVLNAAAKRGYQYINVVMERYPKQWQFYKEVRILNPANLPDMSQLANDYPMLRFPVENKDFHTEWQKYCRVEKVHPANPTDLATYWSKHTGVLADVAKFLLAVPVTSADVETKPVHGHGM